MNGAIGIRFKPIVGTQQLDFLVGRLNHKTWPPTAIEIRRPASWKRPHEERHQQARKAAAEEAGMIYQPIELGEALNRGREWARWLKGELDDRDQRR
jgi:F420-0:gamma-glutamyl ligase-like protein